jgi:hypothetical protein
MTLDRRAIAWDLVQTYMTQHMNEVPANKRSKFTSIDQSQIAPLGALVSFELARRRWSFQQAAVEIGRNIPERLRESGHTLASSTLFYFKSPKHIDRRALPNTLEQLSYGFGWDINWLRRVNCDPIDADTPVDMSMVPEPIKRVIQIMTELSPDMQAMVTSWVESFANSQKHNHNHNNHNTPLHAAHT